MMNKILQGLPERVSGEVFTQQSHSVQVSFSNSQFENISNNKQQNTVLRVIKDGKMGTAASSKPGSEEELRANALETVDYGNPISVAFAGPASLTPIELVDEAVKQVDTRTMVEIAQDLVQALLEYDRRILVNSRVGRSVQEVSLESSSGFEGRYEKTVWGCSLGGQLVQGDDMLWLGDFVRSCALETDYEALKRAVIQQFEWAKNIVPFEAGTYPVIFAPEQIGFLVNPFLASLNGKAIVRDISPWKELIGEELLDQRLTLIDDGTLPMRVSSLPFDREGTPTRRNVLIEQGVVRQELLDLETALALGKESTGNGSGTGPSAHHVLITPGVTPLAEMIRKIDRGLIIYDTMGAWTGNPYSGNVSGTVSMGLKVEKGEIVGRVKDCMFSVNAFAHFRDHLIDISQDTKSLGQASFPYIALDEVVIATK